MFMGVAELVRCAVLALLRSVTITIGPRHRLVQEGGLHLPHCLLLQALEVLFSLQGNWVNRGLVLELLLPFSIGI
jgi:hypothetical protein